MVDEQAGPRLGDLSSGDPGPKTPETPRDGHATPDNDHIPGHHDLPEHHNVSGHGGFGEAPEHFMGAVGNLLGATGEALGHLFGEVGDFLGGWLDAHDNLD